MSWRLRSPKTLAHRWPLNGHADDLIRGQHGTLVNTPTWAVNQFDKQCIELDGLTKHVNLGDVAALNAVQKFTICFWMNQDALDVTDKIFRKRTDASTRIEIETSGDGRMYLEIGNVDNAYGSFDYSVVISALSWHHVAMVFDGSGVANADRLNVYVDGVPITLAFVSTIPATTADLTAVDALIGFTTTSFDGRFSDFRLFYVALTRDEINKIIHSPQPTY